jgi:hypothetical protein
MNPDSEVGGLIWVEGWYQGQYEKFHRIIFLSHILHWPFPSIDFYIANKIFELTNCENNFLRELPLFKLQIILFRIKNKPNTLTFEWKFLFNTSYTFELITSVFHFKLFKLYSSILKCVNLIEIRFYAYRYASSLYVLWHTIFETTAQIPEVGFGGKYGYLRANTDICPVFVLSANNQHWLLVVIGHAKTNILQQNIW